MKNLITLCAVLGLWLLGLGTGRAQTTVNSARYEYCELLTTDNLFSPDPQKTAGDIYVDFGYGFEKLGGGTLSQREAGKLQVFATHVSALTYMGKLGWEIVQMYQQPRTTPKEKPTTIFVLRRPARGN